MKTGGITMGIDAERLENLNISIKVFSWMSKALDYPDQEFVESLIKGEFIRYLPEDKVLGIKAYISLFDSTDDLLLDMQKDYTRMCFVSKPRLVPLFESVYKEGKLFQDSTFQIARLYDEAGIKCGAEFKLPPDHIVLELEFISYLLYQELDALKNGNKMNEEMAIQLQNETIDKHLSQFGLSLAQRLVQHSKNPFYLSVGDILADLFQSLIAA